MAGSSNTPAAKKTAAAKAASPVGTRDANEPLAGAHPLVGTMSVAEAINPEPRTAEEHRAAQGKEYGQWVAVAAITHDGALAYNVGDAVPTSNVEAWGYADLGLVAKTASARAAEAAEQAAPPANPNDPDA